LENNSQKILFENIETKKKRYRDSKAGYPLTKQIQSVHLPKLFWVKISLIRTLSVKRIRGFMGVVNEQELNEIIEGLFLFLK